MANRKQQKVKFNPLQKAAIRNMFRILEGEGERDKPHVEQQGSSKKPRGGGGAPPVTSPALASTSSEVGASSESSELSGAANPRMDSLKQLTFNPENRSLTGGHSKWSRGPTSSHLLDFSELETDGGRHLRDCSGVPQEDSSILLISNYFKIMDLKRFMRDIFQILPSGAFEQISSEIGDLLVNSALAEEEEDFSLLLPLIQPVLTSWPVDKRNPKIWARVVTHFPVETSSSSSPLGPSSPHILLYLTKGYADRIFRSVPIGSVRCYAWQPADIILHMQMIHTVLATRLSPGEGVHLIILPTLLSHALSSDFPENCEVIFRVMWDGRDLSPPLVALFGSAERHALDSHPGEIFQAPFPFLLVRNGASLNGLPFDSRLVSKNMALPARSVLSELSSPVFGKATFGQILYLLLQFFEAGSQMGGGDFASVLDVLRIHRRPNHPTVWMYTRHPPSGLFVSNATKALSNFKILALDASPVSIDPYRLALCSHLHSCRDTAWHANMARNPPLPQLPSSSGLVARAPSASSFTVSEGMWAAVHFEVSRLGGKSLQMDKALCQMKDLESSVQDLEQRYATALVANASQRQDIARLQEAVSDLTSRLVGAEGMFTRLQGLMNDVSDGEGQPDNTSPVASSVPPGDDDPFTTGRLAAAIPVADSADPAVSTLATDISLAVSQPSSPEEEVFQRSRSRGISYATILVPPPLPPWGEVAAPLAQYVDLRNLPSGRMAVRDETCRHMAIVSAGPSPITSTSHEMLWRISVLLPATRWGVSFILPLTLTGTQVWQVNETEIDMDAILAASRTCILRLFPTNATASGRFTTGSSVTVWEPTFLRPWGICTSKRCTADSLLDSNAQIGSIREVNFDFRETKPIPFDASLLRIMALTGREVVRDHMDAILVAIADIWSRAEKFQVTVGPYTLTFPTAKNHLVCTAFRVLALDVPTFSAQDLLDCPVEVTIPMDLPAEFTSYHGFNILHALARANNLVTKPSGEVPLNFINPAAADRASTPKVSVSKRRLFQKNFPTPPATCGNLAHWTLLAEALSNSEKGDHYSDLKTLDLPMLQLLPHWKWIGSAWRVESGQASLLTHRGNPVPLSAVIHSISSPHVMVSGTGLGRSTIQAWNVQLPVWPADATQTISDSLIKALLPAFDRARTIPSSLREVDPTGASYPPFPPI